MRVLVTGGAGCLGANLAERLLEAGHDVLSLDNYATSDPSELPRHDRLTAVEGSVADATLVDRLFDQFQPTHVVHSAASYKDPDNWAEDIATNVAGTAHVCRASLRLGVKRFVYFQTALCYGRARTRPVGIDHPLAPLSSYAISKTAGENYVRLSGLNWVSFRLANVYGPRHYSGPIPTFFKRLSAGQKCFVSDTRRDFIYMDDFLSLMDKALMEDSPRGEFNVSSGRDISIKDLFDALVGEMGMTLDEEVAVLPPDSDDIASLLLDPSETERAFGWRSEIGLAEGLRRQIEWFHEHGIGQTFTHLRIGQKT